MSSRIDFEIVIPTVGRPSLAALLEGLARSSGPRPRRVHVVHDVSPRAHEPAPALPGVDDDLLDRSGARVVRGPGKGPAAARNTGWRATTAEWVLFLDDDVTVGADHLARVYDDLDGLPGNVAGSQGRVVVPLPPGRRPTDWERNVAGLENARWATADMAYRRSVLERLGGFDERFARAYREDADLALRALRAGYHLVVGDRSVTHPVRPAGRWVSVSLQTGNQDDFLMRKLHGRTWRAAAGGGPSGRRPQHLLTTAAAGLALGGALARRPLLARLGAATWAASTATFAAGRIAPGPRSPGEISTMVATSAAIPLAATFHWLAGAIKHARVAPHQPAPTDRASRPQAVFLDRDGTLVHDVPYNGEPERVVVVPGAKQALDTLRAHDIPVAVVSNQSGVGRGLLTQAQVDAVNRRIEQQVGRIDGWFICPHSPEDGCSCRKPGTRLLLDAAAHLRVDPTRCALIGDIGSDVEAAVAAGARAILVPNNATRPEEVEAAPEVAPDLVTAVHMLVGTR